MEFRILGPLEVIEGGEAIRLPGPKQRSLLALLLLHANEVVSSDRLIDELWPGEAAEQGAAALQASVSRLRKALGGGTGVVETVAPGYMLRLGSAELDLRHFEELIAEAEGAEPASAAATLREALALWRGPPLADFAYEPFAQTAIARLEELRVLALEKRIDADLALGRDAELVAELESLVAQHPLREGLRAQLMLALYRAGRQAEALEATRAPAGRWSTDWVSSRAPRSRSSRRRSCDRIRRSSWHRPHVRCARFSLAGSVTGRLIPCSPWPRRWPASLRAR